MSGDLAAGLYLVATPIGSARDITLRALDILRQADVLAAEDTRTLRKLMEIHGVALAGRTILPYHDHNGAAQRPKIAAHLAAGRSVAYASDAGTPLVADPGYALAREMAAAGHAVTTAPGPSAVLAALSLSGLPTDRFLFAGFLPPTDAARGAALSELAGVPATLVVFEAPSRVLRTLRGLLDALGDREAALCRELTKRFEEVRRGPLSDLVTGCEADPPRGEIVLVIDRDRSVADADTVEAALARALSEMSVRDAAQMVAEAYGLKRRDVYQMALEMGAVSGALGHHAGAAAEDIVARHYESRGLTLAHRRWRCKAGEIDLVLRDGPVVVFVEVKLAATHDRAAAKLGPKQIARLFDAVEVFLGGEPGGALTDIRFDVALVDATGRVEIRENAFP